MSVVLDLYIFFVCVCVYGSDFESRVSGLGTSYLYTYIHTYCISCIEDALVIYLRCIILLVALISVPFSLIKKGAGCVVLKEKFLMCMSRPRVRFADTVANQLNYDG